ncbi:MAG TPA: acyl-ACP thioesterase domain-containing protein [Gaiellaceae bacterium]|nr:acyl-ACP thioesterase domain-containing protein [Gaiellaceae bacterium]
MSRVFTTRRRISLSDTDANGRLRVDAIARYLQDVASEDWLDAGFDHDSHVWVVRRTELTVHDAFRPEDWIELETWCSGVAGSAASRRYSIRGEAGGRVEAESIWIHLDHDLRPKRLGPEFLELYGESAAGNRAQTRFTLPTPDDGNHRPWSFRATDIDRLGHVNNAAYWVAVEDRWAGRLAAPMRAALEYRQPIDLGEPVELIESRANLWLMVGDEIRAAAAVYSATP